MFNRLQDKDFLELTTYKENKDDERNIDIKIKQIIDTKITINKT